MPALSAMNATTLSATDLNPVDLNLTESAWQEPPT